MWSYLLMIVVVLHTTVLGFHFPLYARQGELWKYVQMDLGIQEFTSMDVNESWFEQKINHFEDILMGSNYSYNINEYNTNTTFQQRYYELNTYWKEPTGPILLYIGGEGTLDSLPDGFIHKLAKTFQAKILAVEHRYYGKSIPNGNLFTPNYKYLTIEQALADLAYFQITYKGKLAARYKDMHLENKWIVVGGSYPGALSAWYKIAYPHLVQASLSSSGVVQPIYAFDEFDRQVSQAVGSECANALRLTTKAVENAINTGKDSTVKSLFNAKHLEDTDFFYMLADAAAMTVQYGHKNKVCDAMLNVNKTEGEMAYPKAFAAFVLKMYGKDFGSGCFYDTNCLIHEPNRWQDVRSWRWQKCSQLAFFQIAPKTNSKLSLRSDSVTLSYHETQCRRVFGSKINPKAEVDRLNKRFGGKNPPGHQIFFSNGQDDPWKAASVLSSIGTDEIANLAQCNECGHCGDLGRDSRTVNNRVFAQRKLIINYMSKWLDIPAEDEDKQLSEYLNRIKNERLDSSPHITHSTYWISSPFMIAPVAVLFLGMFIVHRIGLLQDGPQYQQRLWQGQYQGYSYP